MIYDKAKVIKKLNENIQFIYNELSNVFNGKMKEDMLDCNDLLNKLDTIRDYLLSFTHESTDINCYKCNFELDTGVRFDKMSCIVFSDNIGKVPNIIYEEFEKHSDEIVRSINIEKINPKEGLICK